MIKLSDFNKIILDGFGTIFDENMHPLKGAEDFIKENYTSMTRDEILSALRADKTKYFYTDLAGNFKDLKDMVSLIDVMVITCIGGSETKNLINKSILKLRKPSSIIVNVLNCFYLAF